MTPFAFALCFVGLPISFGFTLPKLLILALCAWRQGWDGLEVPRRLRWPIAACFAALIITTAFSIAPGMSLWGRVDSWAYGVLSCALYAVVFAAACANPPERKHLAWLGVALAVHAVVQRAGLDPIVTRAMLPTGRAVGYLGTPFDLGAVLCMLMFMSQAPWQAVAMAVGIVAADSRGAMLAIAFGGAAALWPRRARWIAAASLLFFLAPAWLPKDLARREIWKSAADTFMANPLLGAGPDTFLMTFSGERLEMFRALLNPMATQAQAHNDVLQAAATTGLAGLLAYLWLLWRLPATPALVALFAYMKFDLFGLEVYAIAAMIAGMECAALQPIFVTVRGKVHELSAARGDDFKEDA